ncbi:MAG TPA: hypothetical protein VMT68_09220 [Caulobacteraceae bacterium]|nr:hypothetical protein [Caulobacteraceae bacterium]
MRLATILAAAVAMASAGAIAHAGTAADLFSQHDDFTPQPNQIGPQPPHRTLQWNTKTGRWGVNLDMAQPGDRDVQWRDARVGLNYGIAPGVRTGVGVSLGDEQTPDGRRLNNSGPTPRVRLETTFKF